MAQNQQAPKPAEWSDQEYQEALEERAAYQKHRERQQAEAEQRWASPEWKRNAESFKQRSKPGPQSPADGQNS